MNVIKKSILNPILEHLKTNKSKWSAVLDEDNEELLIKNFNMFSDLIISIYIDLSDNIEYNESNIFIKSNNLNSSDYPYLYKFEINNNILEIIDDFLNKLSEIMEEYIDLAKYITNYISENYVLDYMIDMNSENLFINNSASRKTIIIYPSIEVNKFTKILNGVAYINNVESNYPVKIFTHSISYDDVTSIIEFLLK